MTPPLMLNGVAVDTLSLAVRETGAWVVDLDLDVALARDLPKGRTVVTVGSESLAGTVDTHFTNRLAYRGRVMVVGGGNGWAELVPARQFVNDLGVLSTAVLQATAAAVGEVVKDEAPRRLGPSWTRRAGAASNVFDGVPWYVDADGITHVGAPWPRTPLPATARVLAWDAGMRVATIAAESIVWPGTVLQDERFGTAVVRDAEHTFESRGARVRAWCDLAEEAAVVASGGRLTRALEELAKHAIGPSMLRQHVYRVVSQGLDGRLTLQLASAASDAPEGLEAVPVWPGLPSASMTVTPGTRVRVAFILEGPSSRAPVVVGFEPGDGATPQVTLDVLQLAVGAGVGVPVALASPSLVTWIGAVTAYVNGLVPGTLVPPVGMAAVNLTAKGTP